MKKVDPTGWNLTPLEKKILKVVIEEELALYKAKNSLRKVQEILDHATLLADNFEDCLKDF